MAIADRLSKLTATIRDLEINLLIISVGWKLSNAPIFVFHSGHPLSFLASISRFPIRLKMSTIAASIESPDISHPSFISPHLPRETPDFPYSREMFQ
jgi:hypothetical protein